jgi:methionyl-tRNA formyltransferase
MTLRIVFMGTPDFAVPTLQAIVDQGHGVAAVYTQPPRAAGRGMADRKSPVHAFADAHGIPVATPSTLKDADAQSAFEALDADVSVVVAYGLILPPEILAMPKHGCLNLHASRLPRWRGAAPIQRAIMAGDTETAATVMRMEAGLDTGPVCLERIVTIGPDMTAGDLHDRLALDGANLMVDALANIAAGNLACRAQSEDGVTYAKKIEKSEARIDWRQPAQEVHNMIRGLSPFPGAWFEAEIDGRQQRVKVLASEITSDQSGLPGELLDEYLSVACGDGAIGLVRLQRAGKKTMDTLDFLRGMSLPAGTRLT